MMHSHSKVVSVSVMKLHLTLLKRTNVCTLVPLTSPRVTAATRQAVVSQPQAASNNKENGIELTWTTEDPSPVGLPDSILSQGGCCLHGSAPLVVAAVGLQQVQHPVAHHLCVSSLCPAAHTNHVSLVDIHSVEVSNYLVQIS